MRRKLMDFFGAHSFIESFAGFHRVTQSYTEIHRVTQRFTEIHRGTQGFDFSFLRSSFFGLPAGFPSNRIYVVDLEYIKPIFILVM